jgi:uncharacterized damage-inducible protein DinB
MPPEVWLRGPVAGYAPALQPIVHSLLQVVEDVEREAGRLDAGTLWARPGGAASIGFHLRHIAGALDRLLGAARGEPLTAAQLAYKDAEGEPGDPPATSADLVSLVRDQVQAALAQVRATDVSTLTEARAVGRLRLPATVGGLLFHAAEHSTRHAGQIATMVRVLRDA